MDAFDRALRGPWRDSGLLLVPASYRPAPTPQQHPELKYLKTRLTYSELFGAEPTWDQFFGRLSGLGLRPAMAALSDLNSVLHVRGVLNVQDQWVGGTFDADLVDRVQRLPDWRGRVVYSTPQALLVMKAALLHSPDRDDTRSDRDFTRELTELLLMANDLLDVDDKPAILKAKTDDELTLALLPHAIHSTLAAHSERYQVAIGRAWAIFTKLAVRDDLCKSPDFIDLDKRVRELTGLSLEDYFAVGASLALWFFAGANNRDLIENRKLNSGRFFGSTRLDPAIADSVLAQLTQTYESGKDAFEQRKVPARSFTYDFVPFLMRPLYRLDPETTVCVNLPFLESRVTNGVYWLLFDSFSGPDRERLSRFYGQALEAYVRDALLRALPNPPHLARRVFGDFAYKVGKSERLTSDVVALYPGAAIFFEVTATRLRVDGALLSSDPTAFEVDLQKIILKKARQLHDRITDFRSGYYSFDGVTAADLPRIVPVVVTGESFPIWTATMKVINRLLQDDNLLQADGIEPLRVIGADEVEMLESLAERGHSILEVLRRHAEDPGMRNVSLRNFMIERYQVGVNPALQAAFREVGNRIAQVLFGRASLGGPSDDAIRTRAYELWELRGRIDGFDLDDWLQAEGELERDSLRDALSAE